MAIARAKLVQQIKKNCYRKNQSLPSSCYTDKKFLALEEKKVFRAGWVCLGRADEIPNIGDYFATSILNEPLVVVRSEAAKINVFANVCQHRSMPVATGAGNANKFVCPYHAWTYSLDGRLRSAPLIEEKSSLKNCQLPNVKSECWGGFIFATLNKKATSLSKRLAGLQTDIGNYQPENMHHIQSFHETWDCNWKSLVENFLDGYHLSVVHPQTLRPLTPTQLCTIMSSSKAYTGYIANYAKAAPARKYHSSLLTDVEQRQSRLFCIYPSMVASVSPDTLVYLSMQPDGTDKVRVKWGISCFEDHLSVRQKNARVKKWQAINFEDHQILQELQRGLKSSFYKGGQLAPANLEGAVKDFHDYLIKRLV